MGDDPPRNGGYAHIFTRYLNRSERNTYTLASPVSVETLIIPTVPTFRTVNWSIDRILRTRVRGARAPAGGRALSGAPGPRPGQGHGGCAADRPLRSTGRPSAW